MMKMNRKAIPIALIATVFAATLSFAQQPEGAPPDPATHVQRHVQHLTKMLSLTSQQQEQATTIFTNAMSGGASFHDQMKAAHENLQTAVKNNDQNGISQAATAIGNLTAQMVSAHAKAQAAFLQILTPDQQTKLSQMESQHRGMGPMGFGGPGHFMH